MKILALSCCVVVSNGLRISETPNTLKPDPMLCKHGVHIGIIGAGPFGLVAAANAKSRGYCVTVLEKQGDVGGDWRQWGNPWSKLQVHRDTYLIRSPGNIHVKGEDQLALYPSRDSMLKYYQKYATQTGIYHDIIFNAKVMKRRKLEIFYEKGGQQKSVNVTHVYSVPGRVNSRRELSFDSEDKFRGKISYGSGRDLVGFNMTGKYVVIVGQGSFAIENARHALEERAAQVTLLVRHDKHTLIYPKMVSYALSSNGLRIPMVKAAGKMYALAGYNETEVQKFADPPFLTMPPTSDVFFLAIAAGKLKIVRGEVAKLQEHGVVTPSGDVFDADVFIKTVGFQRDHQLDAEIASGGARNVSDQERWWQSFTKLDPALAVRNKVYIGSASNLALPVINPKYPKYPNVYPPETEASRFFNQLDGRSIERHSFDLQHPLDHLEDVRKEWNDYCMLFGVNISYPYTEIDIKTMFAQMESFAKQKI